MNLHVKKLSPKEKGNSIYLSKLYRQQNNKNKGGFSFGGPLGSNRITYPVLSVENFERRFQFNNLVRQYNNLIGNKKRDINGSDEIDGSNKLYLPIIKEIEIRRNGMKNEENGFDESEYMMENSDSRNQSIVNANNHLDNHGTELPNTINNVNDRNRGNNLLGTISTLSQSVAFNASKINTKMELDHEKEKKKLLLRNLSHDSIFAAYKARYSLAIKEFKEKNKLAAKDYKNELEKLKNEKIQISKNAELFKEYELKFNENRLRDKLKDDYNFFQHIEKKTINHNDLRLARLLKKLKRIEEKKNMGNNIVIKHENLKPSQRMIKNMLRKEKKIELYENSLLDFPEQE